MTLPVEDRAHVLALLREREGAQPEAELLRELVRELRAARAEVAGRTQAIDLQLSSITVLRVQVESTPPCGGDAGHGAFSRVKLTDEAGTCWQLVAEDYDGTRYELEPRSVELVVRGDDEQGQLLAALQVAAQVLRSARVEPTPL